MPTPYRITQAASELYKNDVSYHDYGTVKKGNVSLFDYYKVDKISDQQLTALKQYCPDIQLKTSRPSYAPEQKNTLILFPKSAWYRLNKAA